MTNEQTAVMLGGYAELLYHAIKQAEKQIKPTEGKNLIGQTGDIWPELSKIKSVFDKLQEDIDVLKNESPSTVGGFR